MYILVDKENVIMHISKTLGEQKNGNILINNGTLAIPKQFVKEIFEVEEISEGVEEQKYCYTTEKGFYKNENYVEYFSDEDRITALEQAVNSLLGF